MDWLLMIALTCSQQADVKHRPDCQEYMKNCVEWVYSQPETRHKDLTRDDIALWLNMSAKRRGQLCR